MAAYVEMLARQNIDSNVSVCTIVSPVALVLSETIATTYFVLIESRKEPAWLSTPQVASGRERTFIIVDFGLFERPLEGKADVSMIVILTTS